MINGDKNIQFNQSPKDVLCIIIRCLFDSFFERKIKITTKCLTFHLKKNDQLK